MPKDGIAVHVLITNLVGGRAGEIRLRRLQLSLQLPQLALQILALSRTLPQLQLNGVKLPLGHIPCGVRAGSSRFGGETVQAFQ